VALTRHQRNELFQTLDEKGIDPDECELDTSAGASILHMPSRSFFRFIEDADRYRNWWRVVDGPDSGLRVRP